MLRLSESSVHTVAQYAVVGKLKITSGVQMAKFVFHSYERTFNPSIFYLKDLDWK